MPSRGDLVWAERGTQILVEKGQVLAIATWNPWTLSVPAPLSPAHVFPTSHAAACTYHHLPPLPDRAHLLRIGVSFPTWKATHSSQPRSNSRASVDANLKVAAGYRRTLQKTGGGLAAPHRAPSSPVSSASVPGVARRKQRGT